MLNTHTHTHTWPGPGALEGKRKKKADTNDGQKAKTVQAGDGNKRTSRTNLRGETDLNSTGHTPKPHNTLQRGTGEELGTEWGIVGDEREATTKLIARTQFIPKVLCVIPKRDRGQIQPHGHKQLFKFHRIRCTICSASPETKETIPAGKGHACCLLCHAEMQKVGAAATKMEFLVVQGGFTVAEVHLPRFSRDNRTSGTT